MKKTIVVLLIILNHISCYKNNESLNNKISEICLPKDDGTYITLKLTENKSFYEYPYKDLMVDILYYNKNNYITYDDIYDDINIECFKLFEQYNNGIINEMPEIIWHQNIRQSIINDYKYIDAFIFLAYEYTSKNLIRILYLTLSDYYIRVRITPIFDNGYDREILFENIYEETPQYFTFAITFYEEKVLGWDENGAINFGNDLLSGLHGSKIVNLWFNGTEEVLKMIQYK